MRLLKSLEELLYELVSWLLFYPLTLWRCIVRPVPMMTYAEAELEEEEPAQFDDSLSPPILLLITLIISHLFELGFGVRQSAEVPVFLRDEQNLLVFRAVAFSLIPLIFAAQDLLHRQARLNRKTLKPIFYSQSYAAVPFILAFQTAIMVGLHGGTAMYFGIGMLAVGLVWFCSTQFAWQRQVRNASMRRALLTTVSTLLVSIVAVLFILVAAAFPSLLEAGADLQR